MIKKRKNYIYAALDIGTSKSLNIIVVYPSINLFPLKTNKYIIIPNKNK